MKLEIELDEFAFKFWQKLAEDAGLSVEKFISVSLTSGTRVGLQFVSQSDAGLAGEIEKAGLWPKLSALFEQEKSKGEE